ncbi:biotin--[acetyl-CoA-carboxylase] ligase [bacterium]|nr:biotin--[acetyl-CoA-carboxylase] ligase [bacterium]
MNIEFIQEKTKKNKIIGREIIYCVQTTSTNDIAKHLISKGAQEGTVVIADYQSNGRGTQGKSWESEPGVSILLSIILFPKINPKKMQLIVDLGVESVISVLKKIIPDISIEKKHPNDVYADGKKIAGVLVESSSKGNSVDYAVLGIGIDVNNESFSPEVEEVAASLYKITGKRFERENIIVELLKFLDENLKVRS